MIDRLMRHEITETGYARRLDTRIRLKTRNGFLRADCTKA